MKKGILIFLILFTTNSFSQKKKIISKPIQLYSISKVKLGMHIDEFQKIYTDSIEESYTHLSEETFRYERLIINEIECYSVLVSFYKSKLYRFSFKTTDFKMHVGLKSKYGYDIENEYDSYDEEDGKYSIIGSYGKSNNSQILLRQVKDGIETFIMTDKNTAKLADKEGF